jgi:hypothetical protein
LVLQWQKNNNNNLRFSSLQWILFHLLKIIIIIIIIIDKWSVEYSIIGHIMSTLWSWCKKADALLWDTIEWWIRPPIIINSRLGFPAKQLWLTREGVELDPWCDPGKKFLSHIKFSYSLFLQPHSLIKLKPGLQTGKIGN